jgi:hypothetical protein
LAGPAGPPSGPPRGGSRTSRPDCFGPSAKEGLPVSGGLVCVWRESASVGRGLRPPPLLLHGALLQGRLDSARHCLPPGRIPPCRAAARWAPRPPPPLRHPEAPRPSWSAGALLPPSSSRSATSAQGGNPACATLPSLERRRLACANASHPARRACAALRSGFAAKHEACAPLLCPPLSRRALHSVIPRRSRGICFSWPRRRWRTSLLPPS